jgi:hypothetical protein
MARTTNGAVRRATAALPAAEMAPETDDTVRQGIAAFSGPV